jgi:hypothetical protein
MPRNSLCGFICLSMLAAGVAVAQETIPPGPSTTSLTRTYTLPVVGLAGTETLQVNVVNVATVPSTSKETPSCAGAISFANSSGTAIGSPVKFTVGSGQIYSAPLPFSATGYTSRGEILATIQQTVSSLCSMVVSLETFDSISGVTHVLATAGTGGATPIPVPLQVVLAGAVVDSN